MALRIHTLSFMNPVFHEGLNVTVRNGDKWMIININDGLRLVEADRGPRRSDEPKDAVGMGVLAGKLLLPFKLLPEEVVALEHDPIYNTKEKLVFAMRSLYPDFSEDSIVTVLFFVTIEV